MHARKKGLHSQAFTAALKPSAVGLTWKCQCRKRFNLGLCWPCLVQKGTAPVRLESEPELEPQALEAHASAAVFVLDSQVPVAS